MKLNETDLGYLDNELKKLNAKVTYHGEPKPK